MSKKVTNLLPRLVELGLSKQEAQVYLILVEEGPLIAKEIARKIGVLSAAIYRTAKRLERKNLVGILKTSPLTFQAIPPQLSIISFVTKKASELQKGAEEISRLLTQKRSILDPTNIDLIFGKNEIYKIAAREVGRTRNDMLIISIGEYIPQRLLLSMRKAYDRNVVIRLIVHKYDEENRDIIENFKKNGYEVRHYPGGGFHLAIYDGRKTLIIINNPKNTRERVAMQIFSSGLSKALRDYFYSVWKKAVKV